MAVGAILGWQAHGLACAEKELSETWRSFAKARAAWAKDDRRP
jgi:hypothetical protein